MGISDHQKQVRNCPRPTCGKGGSCGGFRQNPGQPSTRAWRVVSLKRLWREDSRVDSYEANTVGGEYQSCEYFMHLT